MIAVEIPFLQVVWCIMLILTVIRNISFIYFLMHFGLSAEVSDQNFEDEDQGEMSSRASMVKRLKTASVDATNNDQVMI